MTEQQIRAKLAHTIAGIDDGRLAVQRPSPPRLGLGSALVAASLGLAASGCPGEPTGTRATTAPTATAPSPATPIDPAPVAEYMAPGPDPAEPVGPPTPEYAAPAPIDPAPVPEYAAPVPEHE